MFTGENTVGTILLTACGVVAAILIWQIISGESLVYRGPGWLPPILGVVVLVSLLWSWLKAPRRF